MRTSTLPSEPSGLVYRWDAFWFTAVSPAALRGLGLLGGLLFLVMMLTFLGRQQEFLGPNGWLDVQAYKEIDKLELKTGEDLLKAINSQRQLQKLPPILEVPRQRLFAYEQGWSIFFLAQDNTSLLDTLYWSGIGIVILFALGVATRITSILTFIWVVSYTANPIIAYEGDLLCVWLAFYLMIGHVLLGFLNGNLSVVEMILGPRPLGFLHSFLGNSEPMAPSVAANYAVRMFQITFALIVFDSAIHKTQIGDWWSGSAFWYMLHQPMQTSREDVVAMQSYGSAYLGFIGILQYIGWAWQLTFPFFAWRSAMLWRTLLLGGAACGWVASWMFGLPLFGEFYMIGCLSYLSPAVWAQALGKMSPGAGDSEESLGRRDKVAARA